MGRVSVFIFRAYLNNSSEEMCSDSSLPVSKRWLLFGDSFGYDRGGRGGRPVM